MPTTETNKYRPSNGTEGDIFMGQWCDKCQRNKDAGEGGCPILINTMLFEIEDAEYPEEWQHDKDGKPCCTAFEEVADD